MKDSELNLAPFYDLLSTAVYPKLNSEFTYKIGGICDFSKIGKKQFDLLDEALEIKRGTMTLQMQNMLELVNDKKNTILKHMIEEHPKIKIPTQICELIERRTKGLYQQGVK